MDKIKIVTRNTKTIITGQLAYDILYNFRDEYDKRNIHYKVYHKVGLFWKRLHTINDL